MHAKRDIQRGISIGKGRQRIKEIGQIARQDVERFLACHVPLGLCVRVPKNPRRDPRGLREIGCRLPRKGSRKCGEVLVRGGTP
ncbi:KH domain-containing protein [Desulfosoma caldarium]|uniref:KH domain-containing protein n=1 Tax=Desulfosoma caldarium TaxID=610254 RepID=UPI000F498CC7